MVSKDDIGVILRLEATRQLILTPTTHDSIRTGTVIFVDHIIVTLRQNLINLILRLRSNPYHAARCVPRYISMISEDRIVPCITINHVPVTTNTVSVTANAPKNHVSTTTPSDRISGTPTGCP